MQQDTNTGASQKTSSGCCGGGNAGKVKTTKVYMAPPVKLQFDPENVKLCFIGDMNVGKTCIVYYYQHRKFSDKEPSTIG
jgi:hypothetical protein